MEMRFSSRKALRTPNGSFPGFEVSATRRADSYCTDLILISRVRVTIREGSPLDSSHNSAWPMKTLLRASMMARGQRMGH